MVARIQETVGHLLKIIELLLKKDRTSFKQEAIMKKILVTGGTTFVSKYVAMYFEKQGQEVYVLNRNTKPQVEGVKLIEADRHDLGDILEGYHFDVVVDVTAYNLEDVRDLIDNIDQFDQYIMISSSAVYPEYGKQPFVENSELAENKYWGKYGTDKIEAEKYVLENVPDAYILRPPYLYGPMNNVYREAFVFDCAKNNRPFYLPKEGQMKLQFFYIEDLCRMIEKIINEKPDTHIINVGNENTVTIREWVTKCYAALGKEAKFICINEDIEQRNYFSFYNYEYYLDVKKQKEILPDTISLDKGLEECAKWYLENESAVIKKPYFEYIDLHF